MELRPIRCLIPDRLHKLGKTQQWLADKTGIPKQRISDYVNMRVVMNLSTAVQISTALHVHAEHLYAWEWRGE